jgi:putative oxidoreductase
MSEQTNARDVGLLILRVGLGLMLTLCFGWMKLKGGPDNWAQVGAAMGLLGIHFAPAFWGFLAMLSEFAGGICLITGVGFRIACAMLAFTMFMATRTMLAAGKGLMYASHSLDLCIVFVALLFIGAGKLSLTDKLKSPWLK